MVNGTLFDGSRHKQAFERNGWPECETCHGKHEIGPASDAMMAVGKPTNLCDPCHAKYGKPSCFETSAFFYQSLVTLRSAHAEIERGAAELAEFGMEVDDLRFGAASIQDAVTQARSLVHSFNRTDFSRPFESGIRTAQHLRADIAAFRREYTQRRSWLIVSTLLITIFAVLLYARIRIADRQGGYRRPQK